MSILKVWLCLPLICALYSLVLVLYVQISALIKRSTHLKRSALALANTYFSIISKRREAKRMRAINRVKVYSPMFLDVARARSAIAIFGEEDAATSESAGDVVVITEAYNCFLEQQRISCARLQDISPKISRVYVLFDSPFDGMRAKFNMSKGEISLTVGRGENISIP